MRYFGALLVILALFVLVLPPGPAEGAARAHRGLARVLPWLYRPISGLLSSRTWRTLNPVIAVVVLAVGIGLLISNP